MPLVYSVRHKHVFFRIFNYRKYLDKIFSGCMVVFVFRT